MKICVYSDRHPRARHIANSLYSGARVVGWDVEWVREDHKEPKGQILGTYGWRNKPLMDRYINNGGHYFYIDLGYWGRKNYQSDYGGYHKVVVDGRHPNEYFQRGRPSDRLDQTAPEISPWRKCGSHIVLAGLSGKGALSLGYEPYEWEKKIINEIRKHTDRRIVYRPKPSWAEAKPITGTDWSGGRDSIYDALINAHLLVTHYSNAAIDALVSGVPIISEDGAAKVMSGRIEDIENPHRPDNREQFLCDLSYCHWRRAEIADGSMFKQFIKDELI